MTFNTKVVGCWWQEDKGEWKVKLRETREGQEPREFEETCDLLLHATGVSSGGIWYDNCTSRRAANVLRSF